MRDLDWCDVGPDDPGEDTYVGTLPSGRLVFMNMPERPGGGQADDDPVFAAWCEEMTAIHEGRATELVRCDQCVPDGGGVDGPLRGMVGSRVSPGPDRTAFYTLSCGHRVI